LATSSGNLFNCYEIVTGDAGGANIGVDCGHPKIFSANFSSTPNPQEIHSHLLAFHTNYYAYPPKAKVFRYPHRFLHIALCRKNSIEKRVLSVEKL
jgi:hypothetical protein